MLTRRMALVGGASTVTALASGRSRAQTGEKPVRIGILEDMSGVFADLGGPSTVAAAKMAVEDFGGKVLGRPIEILSGDHQNKPDLGLNIARRWYDVENVDLITGLTNSAVALAVQKLTADKGKMSIVQNAATDALIEANCSPNGIVWNWTARPIVKSTVGQAIRTGRKTWYFIVSDYAGGKIMEDEASEIIKGAGGSVLGVTRPPVGTSDFASYLVSAQGSRAETLGVMTFGQDFVTLLKQALEFGITPGMQPVAPFVFQSDLNAAGPAAVQGMTVAAPFYWDLNPQTRAFSARFQKATGRQPDVGHAGAYNAITHYLNGIKAANATDANAVLQVMRATPVNDMSTKDGKIRQDGAVVRQIYLFEGKKPSESKDSWDLLRQTGEISKEEAFPFPSPPKCALLKS